MTLRCVAALLAVLFAGGCGSDDQPRDRKPARTQLLRVYDTKDDKLTSLRLRVPIRSGWSGAVKQDVKTPIGGTSRKINERCSLLIQFITGNVDGPLGVPGTREVEHGKRTLLLEGRKLDAESRLYRAGKGLVFSGGATGPGGALLLIVRDPSRRQIVARLVALGGTDGLTCPFGAEEAIERTLAVLRAVAGRTSIERAPA